MADQTDTSIPGVFDAKLLLRQARAYLAFGEQMRQFADQFQETLQHETDWNSALRRHFDRISEAITQAGGEPGINSELTRLWTLILETWREAAMALAIPMAVPEDRNSAAWQAYQQTQSQYFSLLQQAAKDALDLMEQRLGERVAAGKAIESLRELYNLWVECNEETYGRMLRSPEYSELSGRLLNALFACNLSEVKS